VKFQDTWLEMQLEQLAPSARLFISFLVFMATLFMGWSLWLSDIFTDYQNTLIEEGKLKREIVRLKRTNYDLEELSLNREILNKNKLLRERKDRLNRIKRSANSNSFFWFDDAKRSLLLEEILKKSLELELIVDKIEDISSDDNKSLNSNMEFLSTTRFEILGSGDFASVIKLASFIESTPYQLVKIEYLDISKKSEDKLKFSLIFDLYGEKK